jgi:hypothetical protein
VNPKKKQKKQLHYLKMEINLHNVEKGDLHLFEKTGRQLMDYLNRAEKSTMEELNDLVHNLQRTVIGLQKKRINIVRAQQRKNKKKK